METLKSVVEDFDRDKDRSEVPEWCQKIVRAVHARFRDGWVFDEADARLSEEFLRLTPDQLRACGIEA